MEAEEQSELCFPQLGNLSCRKPRWASSQGVLPRVLLPAVCALTVLLNLLVVIAISHFRRLHTPTNLLLLSLAVADFLVGLVMWPGELYMSTSCWAFGDVACFCYHLVSFVVTSVSVGHMVLISADRYVAICDPLRYGVKVTVKRIQGCVCLCWFLSFLYCCALLREPLARPEECSSCRGECVIAVDVDGGLLDLIVVFVLPLCVIVTLYARVFAAAASQARALRSRVAGGAPRRGAKRSELKAARTLGVLVLVFLLCYCPFYIVALVGELGFSSSAQYALYLLDFNSCANPLIYALFYPWFRRAVGHIVTLRVLRPGSRGADLL
ncbi:trace amine-associated receptor 13c-like [Hippocampus comes]|uniref:trace amine-associated receptor 13c-like n=1 Tax=Hippocampus comes TaxID=109280 RepID=UPI00094F1A63|nr:PREDICTED: trace amine-associated receptor 13c-like [Hippocampus comes]